MIIYFAGNGCHAENINQLHEYNDWGVLLSYKDLKNNNPEKEDSTKRFRLLKERKKEGSEK